jgi:hypothetical protein
VPLTSPARQVLDTLVAFERAVQRAANAGQRASAQLLISVLHKRAASSLHALEQSLGRRLEWLQAPDRAYRLDWLQPPLPFIEEESQDSEERLALVAESGLTASHERTWIRRLRLLCLAALPRDPKPHHLVSLLTRSAEPAVVFTEYRATLDCLQKRLAGMRTVTALHGGLTTRERRDQLEMFLSGRASVLLATDVGGQGLNLQSRGRWVINVDVPWNPARLRQRVGRVDRIGQSRRVHTTTLSLPHIVEDHVVESLARREQRVYQVMGAAPSGLVTTRTGERRTATAASPPAGALAVCDTFRRRARAMARALNRRRVWLRRWHGPCSPESRPCRTRGGPPGDSSWADALVAVVLFPIVDAAGAIVEQHVRAVRVEQPVCDADALTLSRLAGHVLARSMRARVARISGAMDARAAAELSIETAIGELVHSLTSPEETQIALFSQRERTDFDRAQQTTDQNDADRSRRLTDLKASRTVDVGDLTIVAVFGARR